MKKKDRKYLLGLSFLVWQAFFHLYLIVFLFTTGGNIVILLYSIYEFVMFCFLLIEGHKERKKNKEKCGIIEVGCIPYLKGEVMSRKRFSVVKRVMIDTQMEKQLRSVAVAEGLNESDVVRRALQVELDKCASKMVMEDK